MTKEEKGSIIVELSGRALGEGAWRRESRKKFEKIKKLLKKVLTKRKRCDIIVKSPPRGYREGLRGDGKPVIEN